MSRLFRYFIVVLFFLGLALPTYAGTSTFNINVRASIPTYTSLVLAKGINADSLNISDVSNQSVMVDDVGSMNIQTNAPNGFSLSVVSLNDFYLVRPGEFPPTISPSNTNFFKYAIRLIMFSSVYVFGPSPYSTSKSYAASSGLVVTGNIRARVGIMLGTPELDGPKTVAYGSYRDRITISMSAL